MFYTRHIFICTNQKAPGKRCCGASGGSDMFLYAKKKLKDLGLHGEGQVRVSQSGCLGRCNAGPCLVIYPEGVWYTYASTADLDEIINTHLRENGRVQRLLMEQP